MALNDYKASPLFNDVERTTLEYVDQMTITGRDVSDELFARLREFYSEDEIIELTEGELKGRIEVKGGPARLRLSPDEKQLLVTLIGSGEVAVIETASLQIITRFFVGKSAEGITLDQGTQYLFVSAQGENKILRFSLHDWKRLQEIKTGAKPDPIVILKSSVN